MDIKELLIHDVTAQQANAPKIDYKENFFQQQKLFHYFTTMTLINVGLIILCWVDGYQYVFSLQYGILALDIITPLVTSTYQKWVILKEGLISITNGSRYSKVQNLPLCSFGDLLCLSCIKNIISVEKIICYSKFHQCTILVTVWRYSSSQMSSAFFHQRFFTLLSMIKFGQRKSHKSNHQRFQMMLKRARNSSKSRKREVKMRTKSNTKNYSTKRKNSLVTLKAYTPSLLQQCQRDPNQTLNSILMSCTTSAQLFSSFNLSFLDL